MSTGARLVKKPASIIGDPARINHHAAKKFPAPAGLTSRPAFLDSSLRWAATGIPPSRRIQDFLSINDGEERTSGLPF